MDLGKLQAMSKDDLLNLARSQGLTVHHRSKEVTIIKAIMDSLQPQAPQIAEHVSQRPAAPVFTNTPEEVEAAIASIKARQPKLESSYEDDVWTFSFRSSSGRITHAESGNLHIPLRTIVSVARRIAEGPVALRGLNEHFDRINATGNNAYTNTVLS